MTRGFPILVHVHCPNPRPSQPSVMLRSVMIVASKVPAAAVSSGARCSWMLIPRYFSLSQAFYGFKFGHDPRHRPKPSVT